MFVFVEKLRAPLCAHVSIYFRVFCVYVYVCVSVCVYEYLRASVKLGAWPALLNIYVLIARVPPCSFRETDALAFDT